MGLLTRLQAQPVALGSDTGQIGNDMPSLGYAGDRAPAGGVRTIVAHWCQRSPSGDTW
jgi:hypothetical protein